MCTMWSLALKQTFQLRAFHLFIDLTIISIGCWTAFLIFNFTNQFLLRCLENSNQCSGNQCRANGIFAYLLIESFYFLILQKSSLIILTVCLIRIPSMIVDILLKEISLTKTASITEVVELVAKWKAIWLAICDLVINSEKFHSDWVL